MTETSAPLSPLVGVGRQLVDLRQNKGMTIQDISARLRFSIQQLTLLEAGQYDALPDMTFVRAMIRAY
ncbi:MAG: helix-turn-helix domain-containing protein, partial [Burkholderiales bacterium]